MSNGIGEQKLMSCLRPEDSGLWSIVKELADTPEAKRRSILRPHSEAGFALEDGAEQIQQRLRLDQALGALTVLEIAYEVGIVTETELPAPDVENLKTLFDSEALLRYVNAYLYFGIRFLAGRIAPFDWVNVAALPEPRTRNSNDRNFPFVTPPNLVPSRQTDTRFATLVDLAQSTYPASNPDSPQIPEVKALEFLDGVTKDPKEPEWFELWLRGLRPETDPITKSRFSELSRGLREWAIARSEFYASLQPPSSSPMRVADGEHALSEEEDSSRPLGGWIVTNPAAARFGLTDVYWIARLLRADVSANASVTYPRANWLHLLRFEAGLRGDTSLEISLWKAEEILRSVFDFVCDVVQNAVELTADKERQAYERESQTKPPEQTVKWRKAFDEELKEIDRQRDRRRFMDPSPTGGDTPAEDGPTGGGKNGGDEWMERIRTGNQPHNLIGLAFSGGGIRSATFNLGVLQGLQEFDLLRQIDFLSTVSGGGFIGSWLVANVRRTAHWLGRLMSWEESIAHLRRYSNYLAPRAGVLTTDTWTMWASWARNAFLIQLTGLAWLFALLLSALLGQSVFRKAGALPAVFGGEVPDAAIVAGCMTLLVLISLLYNLTRSRAVSGKGKAFRGKWVRRLVVLPSWISSFLLASLLWADATGRSALSSAFSGARSYSTILLIAWHPWLPLLVVIWLALVVIAFATLFHHQWHALWISTLCVLVLYLELCGIMRLFMQWSGAPYKFVWYAYVIGAPLVLAATTISVGLFIGFCGRNSIEPVREWWTRFGTWLAIYGAGYLAIATAAVFGPLWTLSLLHSGKHWSIKGSFIASWIGTVIGGLLAGKSSKTTGNGSRSMFTGLEILAKLGGLLFIVGTVLAAATTLYALLVKIGTDCSNLSEYWDVLSEIPLWTMAAAFAVAILCGTLFSWFFEINIFGLNQFYRNRIVRCYLGATRWTPGFRKPQPFTKFDGKDDMPLSTLGSPDAPTTLSPCVGNFRGPFPIFNCALNLGGSSDLALHTRHSASFSLTPLRCGADRRRVGYAPTKSRFGDFANGVMLGQAVAISGAAASPNMGYNTSPLVAFMLTMFNVRLGWWFPNPGQHAWNNRGLRFSLYYLLKELFGVADEKNLFVNVSDGGHFENLGIYELVRRRCKVIIAADAECDEVLQFGSLGNLVRLCETDFGVKIDIDVSSIRQQKDGFSLSHCTIGKIIYSNGSIGYLVYLKASVSGDEDVGVTQYRSVHPSFPHETTANQFFSEDQFESYRKLGQHVVQHSLRGNQPGDHPVAIAEKLADVLAPAGGTSEAFLTHTKALDEIWERFRQYPDLHPFMEELMGSVTTPPDPAQQTHESIVGLELIQFMENVFLDLRLDDFWDHPDNRGWAILFMRWARSPRFRAIWVRMRRAFSIRFEYFCEARLGLPRDKPIVRV